MSEISRRERIVKIKQQKRQRRLGVLIIGLLFLGGIGWLTFNWVKTSVMSHLIKTAVVNNGTIQTTVPAQGLVILDEEVVTAPVNGSLRAIIGEGERAGLNAEIARFRPVGGSDGNEISIKAPLAGVVCYHPDGLEGILTPQTWDNLDLDQLDQLSKPAPQDSAMLSGGQPVAKIINNLTNPQLIVRLSPGINPPAAGQTIYLQLAQNQAALTGETIAARQDQSGIQVLVRLKEYRPDLVHQRRLDLSYITERYTGVVVPISSLVERNGEMGVYVLNMGQVVWKRVEVAGRVAEEAAVRGLNTGTEIIINANLAKEGQFLQ